MSWYKRIKEGITTKTSDKKTIPDGIWHKCKDCQRVMSCKEHEENNYVCIWCDYHTRIGSNEYFQLLFDGTEYDVLFKQIKTKDVLHFRDKKTYKQRLRKATRTTGLDDAIQIAVGPLNGQKVVIGGMDFRFIGGSMGAVVGERIARAIQYCVEHQLPLIIISKSGGARMMESAFSLMQMAKTAAQLTLLAQAKLPYISLLTDPTTGGVSASYAMLGDVNIAEPKALIGFAGPRVIRETIRRDLPKGFQTSEFLLDHGFLDKIVHRKDLKNTLADLLFYFKND